MLPLTDKEQEIGPEPVTLRTSGANTALLPYTLASACIGSSVVEPSDGIAQ